MGWGDEILASGRAREAQESDPRPVAILNRHGHPRWHEAWRGNPRIVHPHNRPADYQTIQDGPRCRPYVDTSNAGRWRFVPGRQRRGELYLDARERAMAPQGPPYAVLQPHTKPGQPNKAWGWARWADLARLLPFRLVMPGPSGWNLPPGVERVETATFRQATGVLAGARMAILPEGGLHHAAAALEVPAVVLYGGFITPEITGYPEQVAFVDRGAGTPCGTVRAPCAHCAAAWARIEPEAVAEAAIEMWESADGRKGGTAAA